jgi:predicted DNA-binding transcriptional regulator AlpA
MHDAPPFEMSEAPGRKLLLSRKDLKGLGIDQSNTTLLRWEALGRFPHRLYLAGTTVRWLSSEVYAWLAERAQERASHVYAEN